MPTKLRFSVEIFSKIGFETLPCDFESIHILATKKSKFGIKLQEKLNVEYKVYGIINIGFKPGLNSCSKHWHSHNFIITEITVKAIKFILMIFTTFQYSNCSLLLKFRASAFCIKFVKIIFKIPQFISAV